MLIFSEQFITKISDKHMWFEHYSQEIASALAVFCTWYCALTWSRFVPHGEWESQRNGWNRHKLAGRPQCNVVCLMTFQNGSFTPMAVGSFFFFHQKGGRRQNHYTWGISLCANGHSLEDAFCFFADKTATKHIIYSQGLFCFLKTRYKNEPEGRIWLLWIWILLLYFY